MVHVALINQEALAAYQDGDDSYADQAIVFAEYGSDQIFRQKRLSLIGSLSETFTLSSHRGAYKGDVTCLDFPESKLYFSDLSDNPKVPYFLAVEAHPSHSEPTVKRMFQDVRLQLEKVPVDDIVLDESRRQEVSSILREKIREQLTNKISFVGFAGVGKTTLIGLLMENQVPFVHNPTMEYRTVRGEILGEEVIVWDTPGQERMLGPYTQQYLSGTNLAVLVMDSSLENVLKSKKRFLTGDEDDSAIIPKVAPFARIVGVANKQDESTALAPERIEQISGVPTIGCTAIDPEKKGRILEFLGKHMT